MRVDISEYPKALSWEMKSFSMPNIPRGTSGMKENLRVILEMVRNNISPSQRLSIEGSESKGSSPFSGVSSLFTGVSDIFTSLFRRASLFPGVSPKLLIILVSTRFFSSSSLFSGVPDSCHQIFLKLHQLSLKLPITFFPC